MMTSLNESLIALHHTGTWACSGKTPTGIQEGVCHTPLRKFLIPVALPRTGSGIGRNDDAFLVSVLWS